MSEAFWLAVVGLGLPAAGLLGTIIGARINAKSSAKVAAETASVELKAHEDTAQDKLINNLQEELERYRVRTDKRLDELENLVSGYRGFIGVQRDHMAEHGTPLPPWPDDLPR